MKSASLASAGFVLHSWPYQETSLIIEAMTRSHGRLAFVAKGAKRPGSAMRGLLNPFQRLHFCWTGKADLKTLKSCEHERIYPQLAGAALMSAFYMSELLLKLTHHEDPQEGLFDAYDQAIEQLAFASEATETSDLASVLRCFELTLLSALGYALTLTVEANSQRPIEAGRLYAYWPDHGPVVAARERGAVPGNELTLSGKTLLDMASNDYSDPQTRTQAKQLMRLVISHRLGNKLLHTRQLVRELQGS